jgi:hypothetical protein
LDQALADPLEGAIPFPKRLSLSVAGGCAAEQEHIKKTSIPLVFIAKAEQIFQSACFACTYNIGIIIPRRPNTREKKKT